MTRTTRTALIILFTGSGLVAAGGMALVYAVPSYKMAAKEKWHRWKCPDVPSARSERVTATDGAAFYQEPSLLAGRFAAGDPNPYFGFDDPRSTFFTEEDGRGVLWLEGTSPAIVRDLADVSDSLVAIGAGLLFRSEDEDPDVRCWRLANAVAIANQGRVPRGLQASGDSSILVRKRPLFMVRISAMRMRLIRFRPTLPFHIARPKPKQNCACELPMSRAVWKQSSFVPDLSGVRGIRRSCQP